MKCASRALAPPERGRNKRQASSDWPMRTGALRRAALVWRETRGKYISRFAFRGFQRGIASQELSRIVSVSPAIQSSRMPLLAERFGLDRATLNNCARTTFTAVASMLLAYGLKLPEFYWAPISAIVILLSPSDPVTTAWQRFAGTALGVIVAAAIATFFHPNWIAYGAGIFICGILSAVLRIGRAYRFAGIALSIVMLIASGGPPWMVAVHRFIEVSLGIGVALLVGAVWPATKS